MKAKLKANIVNVSKNVVASVGNTDATGMTEINLVATKGKVNTSLINAQTIMLSGKLFLKEAVANQIKIGATITITLSDEEVDD